MALATVHAGWLTKSPPEKKLQGPLKFFKAHWRRRYFVLSTGPSQSPSSSSVDDRPLAYLHYYDNEKNPKKSRKKGCIDLSNCEEILAQLDSVFYEHVFSLRTLDRGKTRTYYLAADSVEDMNLWINCLCRVLRMNDSSDSGMPSPEPFSSSLVGQNFSVPNRKTSIATKIPDLSPINHQQQPLQPSPCPTSSSYISPHSHVSLVFDYPSSSCCQQPEDLRYGGPRGIQSYYPPMASGSCYFPDPVSLSPSDSPPPPSLPAKSSSRRSTDRLDPFARPSSRISEYSHSSSSQFDAAASVDFHRSRFCHSFFGGGGDEYDLLPGRNLDDEYDYDFPPAAKSGITSGQPPTPDHTAKRASTSSYPDVFDEEDIGRRLPISQSSGPPPFQMTSRTRSFRRSISRSDPPVSVLEPCEDQEEEMSNYKIDEDDRRFLKKSSAAATATGERHPDDDIV